MPTSRTHCPTALGDGPRGIGAYHDAVLELANDVNLLIHDSHLRAEEVAEEGSFGHAAAEYAVKASSTSLAGAASCCSTTAPSAPTRRWIAPCAASPRAPCRSSVPRRGRRWHCDGPVRNADAVVVGAGPNGLVAALALARVGLAVNVYEAADEPGGGCRTAELTVAGFRHDICSAVHPLLLASPASRRTSTSPPTVSGS